MFSGKASTGRKRRAEPELAKSDKGKRSAKDRDLDLDFDFDLDLSKFISIQFPFFVFLFRDLIVFCFLLMRQWRSAIENFDGGICSDIKGIVSALQQIREKAQKDGQKKNEETISR